MLHVLNTRHTAQARTLALNIQFCKDSFYQSKNSLQGWSGRPRPNTDPKMQRKTPVKKGGIQKINFLGKPKWVKSNAWKRKTEIRRQKKKNVCNH